MKKNISKIFLLSIAFFFVSCDKGEPYYHQWEGEYVAKQTMEVVYDDGTTETHDYYAKEQPLFIFRDKGLYVQTYGIGEPYIPGVDSEEHILRLISPRLTNMMKDGVEPIVDTNPQPYNIMRNGGVYTYYNGTFISPKPILVSKASTDKLTLANSASFEVELTDENAIHIGTPICYWEYSPIQKQNEIYIWEAELHFNTKNSSGQTLIPAILRHHFVLTRK